MLRFGKNTILNKYNIVVIKIEVFETYIFKILIMFFGIIFNIILNLGIIILLLIIITLVAFSYNI